MKKVLLVFVLSAVILVGAVLVLGDIGSISKLLLSSLSKSFSKEELKYEFKSYLTEVRGLKRLQVAELKQLEVLSQTSRRLVFWSKLELPPVVVAVEVPVVYTYFLDLDKAWSFEELDSGDLKVTTPPIEFNQPAADISAMEIRVEKASILRNEKNVTDRILKELSGFLENRAKDHMELVRENSRKQIREVVEAWLLEEKKFSQSIKIQFPDEVINSPDINNSL